MKKNHNFVRTASKPWLTAIYSHSTYMYLYRHIHIHKHTHMHAHTLTQIHKNFKIKFLEKWQAKQSQVSVTGQVLWGPEIVSLSPAIFKKTAGVAEGIIFMFNEYKWYEHLFQYPRKQKNSTSVWISISWVNMMEASESHGFLIIVCSLTRKVYRNYLFVNLFVSLPHKCQRGTDKKKLRTCKNMLCDQESYLAWLWHLNLRHQNFRSIMNILSIGELWNYNFMHFA